MLLPSKDLTLQVFHAQAAMMNWGKQSAFDMFSNLMTFQALASQQCQAQGAPADHAAMPVAPAAGAGMQFALTVIVISIQRTSGVTSCGALNEILQAVMPLATFHTEASEASSCLDSAKVEASDIAGTLPDAKTGTGYDS